MGPSTIVALPVLDVLHQGLEGVAEGHVANKVPLNQGALQVGYRGRPEGFGVLDVTLQGDGIHVTADSPHPLEGPFVDTSSGQKRVGRATIGPLAEIVMLPTDVSGEWAVTVIDAAGERVPVNSDERVIMARTLAKLADVSLGRINRSNPKVA